MGTLLVLSTYFKKKTRHGAGQDTRAPMAGIRTVRLPTEWSSRA
jgi:hypothetical protein